MLGPTILGEIDLLDLSNGGVSCTAQTAVLENAESTQCYTSGVRPEDDHSGWPEGGRPEVSANVEQDISAHLWKSAFRATSQNGLCTPDSCCDSHLVC